LGTKNGDAIHPERDDGVDHPRPGHQIERFVGMEWRRQNRNDATECDHACPFPLKAFQDTL
jgi:hypothetical protein